MLLGMLKVLISSLWRRFWRCAFGLMYSPEAITKSRSDFTEAMDNGSLCEARHFLRYRTSVPEKWAREEEDRYVL